MAEPIFAKHEAGDGCRGLGERRFSAVEEAVAAVPERVQFPRGPPGSGAPQNARHAVRLAIRARISGRDRRKISGSDGRGHAPTLRSGKGQRSCRGLCDGKVLSRHILALDPSQKADCPKFVSYGSVAQYYYESGKNGSRDQVG
ncbi:hypothetical protein [Bradyrhizobium sp. 5.13L]